VASMPVGEVSAPVLLNSVGICETRLFFEEPRRSIPVRASSVPNTCNLVIESAIALFQILACLFKRSLVLLVLRQPSLSVN